MTDYCNSACQRHRPAATTNQYTPGHSQTHTNTSKQACATHVCHPYMVSHKHSRYTDIHAASHTKFRTMRKHNRKDVYMSAHLPMIAGVTQKAHRDISSCNKVHMHAHTTTSQQLQATAPHWAEISLISVSLGGHGRAKWLLQSPSVPPTSPSTFLASITSSTHTISLKRGESGEGEEKEEREEIREGERQGLRENWRVEKENRDERQEASGK